MSRLLVVVATVAACGCSSPATAPAPVARVEIVAGDFQFGVPGYVLGDSVAVRVIDGSGAPVPGALITWIAENRDAAISPATSVTGPDGIARAAWRLGRDDGEQRVRATFSNLPGVRFTANSRTGDVLEAGGSTNHQCGRFLDDVVRCWRSPDGGPAAAVALDTDLRFSTIAYAAGAWCGGTRDGAIACFDDADLTPGGNFRPDAAPVRVVATGVPLLLKLVGTGRIEEPRAWCGIAIDSKVLCWGDNRSGQLGDGTIGGVRNAPVEVVGPLRALSIAVTPGAACAVDLDSRAWCWGSVADGVVDAAADSPVPVPVPGPTTRLMVQIAADGSGSVCGFDAVLQVSCWGSGRNGGRGRGGVGSSPTPVLIEGTDFFTSISATSNGFLAVTVDRDLVVWGGLTGTSFTERPASVLSGYVFADVLPGGGEGAVCLRAFPVGTRCVDRIGLARALEVPPQAQLIHGVPKP